VLVLLESEFTLRFSIGCATSNVEVVTWPNCPNTVDALNIFAFPVTDNLSVTVEILSKLGNSESPVVYRFVKMELCETNRFSRYNVEKSPLSTTRAKVLIRTIDVLIDSLKG
jgi:hypothetical protein